jgi:hypothetical protein
LKTFYCKSSMVVRRSSVIGKSRYTTRRVTTS